MGANVFHHDGRDYDVAAGEAAREGRKKMEAIIQRGKDGAERVVNDIMAKVINDRIARAPSVRLTFDDDGEQMLSLLGDEPVLLPVHDHAFGQLLDNTGVTKKFADHLVKEAGGDMWGKRLLAENVNTILSHRAKQRNLVRQEGADGPVKGFLSDRFRRLDSRPLLEAFIVACLKFEMLPIEGVASDTKCRVRAVLPLVFEPVRDEVMLFGAEFGNSDYGDGGVVLNLWTMRVWCTNTAVIDKVLRTVHLGGRLPDHVRFSDETYRKDAETTALAIRDMTEDVVGPDRINRILGSIRDASETEIRGRDGIDKALARVLDKSELTQVKNLFDGPDVQNLPAEPTVWRLSNAVSWFAQTKGVTPDRKLELQDIAGRLVAGDSKVKEV